MANIMYKFEKSSMSQKNGLKKLFSRKLVTEKALLVEINVITIKPL